MSYNYKYVKKLEDGHVYMATPYLLNQIGKGFIGMTEEEFRGRGASIPAAPAPACSCQGCQQPAAEAPRKRGRPRKVTLETKQEPEPVVNQEVDQMVKTLILANEETQATTPANIEPDSEEPDSEEYLPDEEDGE